MPKYITIKEYLVEAELYTRRILVVFFMVFVMAVLLVFRLFSLQVLQHDRYTTLSKQNLLKIEPIEPKRGLIYDRNGILLADNIPAFNLEITRTQVKNLKKTIAALKKILPISDNEINAFNKLIAHRRRFEPVPLKIKLNETQIAKFYVNRYQFPGVDIHARLIRRYPLAEKLAHVVGYVGRINATELAKVEPAEYSATNTIGKIGIEKYYEDTLHGHVGYQQVESDATGHAIRVLKHISPESGDNLYLTIDARLQYIAQLALRGKRGALVAIDPNTGQVLAMVSMPSFDPNPFVTGITSKMLHELYTADNQPLYNRAIHAQYPPGSTIKPFISLAGLAYHATYPNRTIEDPGWFRIENSKHIYHDWKPGGHGIVNLRKAIIVSCDTYFYDLAERLGIKHISAMLHLFGFGELTGIDMPNELTGVIPNKQWKEKHRHAHWFKGDTINSIIGQGYMLSTPLQLASATATLATHGHRLQPTMLLKKNAVDGSVTQQQPIELDDVDLMGSSWRYVIQAMKGVIEARGGTGFRFGRHAPFSTAAKTGTSQVASKRYDDYHTKLEDIPEHLRDHSLFIAFVPVENPQIALSVIVENDSHAAVVVARQVLDYYFKEICHGDLKQC